MRKSVVVLALAVASLQAYAQNNKVVSAYAHMQNFTSDHDTAELKEARAAIDEAAVNEKTKNEPKMFLYRGMVYETVYETQISNISKKALTSSGKMDQASVQKAQTEAYLHADTGVLSIAGYSYLQVIQIDPKSDKADDARKALMQIGGHMMNVAVCEYNAQNFTESFIFFERVLRGMKNSGVADTSAEYKHLLQNTAGAAEKAKNVPKAIAYYNEMISLKAGKDMPYSALNRLYMNQRDTTKALAVITQGRAAYPDDINLLNAETNGYLWRHQTDKAEGNLQLAIDKLSKQSNLDADQKELLSRLYAILGGIFDRQANPRDDKNNNLPMPANYKEMFQKADTNYKMALALAPEDFDYNFDIGALYNNRAKYVFDQLNALPEKQQAAKSKVMEDEARGYLKYAQPFLEKAYKLHADDHSLRIVLLHLYASTGQEDKAKALTEQK
jgi:hypothetical protein